MSEKESSSPWAILTRDIADVYRTLLDNGMPEAGAISITHDIAREMIHMVVNSVTLSDTITMTGIAQPAEIDPELLMLNAKMHMERMRREDEERAAHKRIPRQDD